jgi:PmbA protein
VRLGEVETVENHLGNGVGVTVYFGRRKGSANTNDLDEQALASTVQAACAIARYTAEDECAGLADAERMAASVPDLDLCHPWPMATDQAIDLALRCEDAARAADQRISNSDGATVSCYQALRAYGNSHGFRGSYESTRHGIRCAMIAGSGDGMQRDGWYTRARAPGDLDTPEAVGAESARRTACRLGARQIPTCEAPVLFAAPVATTVLAHFLGAIQGGALYRKSSFLLDHLGRRIFPTFVRIHEQPYLPRAIGSTPFDAEGVAPLTRDIVSEGVLQGYVLDSYAARRLQMESTGNAGGVHNLTLEPGAQDLEGLLARMDTGLLVTELMGQGVNLVTGDYSRGASGFWVEKGQISFPVEEITIAGKLPEMFQSLLAVGADEERRGNLRTGSLLIERMTIAGG